MSELRELYQELILDHNKQPRNFRVLQGAHREAEGYNPLCGDQVRVYVDVQDDRIQDVTFQGNGCAISQASASLMTEALKGLTLKEALAVFDNFQRMLTQDESALDQGDLGKLEALSGVKQYPMRVKCATLAWHTLKSALEGRESVTTD